MKDSNFYTARKENGRIWEDAGNCHEGVLNGCGVITIFTLPYTVKE
jgi:hypothetical protein